MSAPIIFIHYGNAPYLRWTLQSAHKTNHTKRIILLGDECNSKSTSGVADFIDFESLAGGPKELEFQRIFQVIQGERHQFNKMKGVEYWLKFVFRRWFLMEEFLRREKIDAFWTFDSDTLILASLESREARFNSVGATTQCRDACINGWIGSRQLVERYTECILDLFKDDMFLDEQRARLVMHCGLAFNEMDAFCEFRRRKAIVTWHAAQGICGEAFDDALAFTDNFEVAPKKILGRTAIKRLWCNGTSLFAKRTDENSPVRLLTCNMSWMPDYFWKRIASHCLARQCGCRKKSQDLFEIDYREPLYDRFIRKISIKLWHCRRSMIARILSILA